MRDEDRPDMSQRAMYQHYGWFPESPEQHAAEVYEIDFEHAFPPPERSTKYDGGFTFADFTDKDYFTRTPYSRLPEGIAADLFPENDLTLSQRLFLHRVVTDIGQDEHGVTVRTQAGEMFKAEHVIVTVSLGVLQHHYVHFQPDLPAWKWDAIHAFEFGQFLNVYLLFAVAFWDERHYVLHASPRRGYFTVWQNLNKHHPGCNILNAITFHTEAERLLLLSDTEIQAEAMGVLRGMYGDTVVPDPDSILVSRIGSDPLFMGSFSNWPPGFSHDSFHALQASIGRVFFGGDYVNYRYYGYVHGAFLAGEQAAQDVLECLRYPDICCHRPDFVPPYEAYGCTYNAARNYDVTAQVDDGTCVFPQSNGAAAAVVGGGAGGSAGIGLALVYLLSAVLTP
jgi:polyamine oxidase